MTQNLPVPTLTQVSLEPGGLHHRAPVSNDASQQDESLSIIFRCAPEHKGVVPPPIPAVQGLPDWFKAMPQRAFSDTLQLEQMTVKRCPPFIDAMTQGFLIPLATDLRVEDGVFTWDGAIPCARVRTNCSPLDFHDNNQVKGSPFFEEDHFVLKFNCFWTIELPPGYSLFVTHPINRPDLPFVSLTGLIDADRYRDTYVNFPARWRDPAFNGVLPKGTPVVQCVPIKREAWTACFGEVSGEAATRMRDTQFMLADNDDAYRPHFRAAKR